MTKGVSRGPAIALGVFLLLGQFAHAHEKWLVPEPSVKRFASAERPEAFRKFWPGIALALGAAAAISAAAIAADTWLRRRHTGASICRALLGLRGVATPLVGITTGTVLIAAGIDQSFLAPDLRLSTVSPHVLATALAGVEIGIGVLLVAGLFARAAALALLVFWILGAALFDFRAWIDYLDVAGFATFLALCGRGACSLDELRGEARPSVAASRTAVAGLRLALGINLAILAINNKLANPLVSMKIVSDYHLNFTRFLGPLAFPDDRFVLAAFAVELAVGLAVATGALLRPVAVVVFVLMTSTYFIFGFRELLGHLPIMAGGFALLCMGTGGKWRLAKSDAPACAAATAT